MNTFESILKEKIILSLKNNYGIENYDQLRFGPYHKIKNTSLKKILRNKIKKFLFLINRDIRLLYPDFERYNYDLNFVWDNLISIEDKNLLTEIIAYRILGYKHVKLSTNNIRYHAAIELAKKMSNNNNFIETDFTFGNLSLMDLSSIGKNIKLYYTPLGVAITFILEQYSYSKDKVKIQAEPGDYVLDIGGCWGDTAIYFADKVGNNGRVYSFEFISKNIEIFNLNISLNKDLESRIQLIERPVTNISGTELYFKDNGPGSFVSPTPFKEQTGVTKSISIDDFIESYNIDKVDFIKMDIEGAELLALKGAIKTIRKFRPKLAIAIYHSMDDFVNIPKWIYNLNLNYKLYLGHYTIHKEETIIFARPSD